jgi:hypothetical protein
MASLDDRCELHAVRWVIAALLLAALTLLPAMDAVHCPDGCTDRDHSPYACQYNVSGAHGACGLCSNAVAIRKAIARLDPPSEPVAIDAPSAMTFISNPLRSVDRPPRHS